MTVFVHSKKKKKKIGQAVETPTSPLIKSPKHFLEVTGPGEFHFFAQVLAPHSVCLESLGPGGRWRVRKAAPESPALSASDSRAARPSREAARRAASPPGSGGSPWSWRWCTARRWPPAPRSTSAGGCGPGAPRRASAPSPGTRTSRRRRPGKRERADHAVTLSGPLEGAGEVTARAWGLCAPLGVRTRLPWRRASTRPSRPDEAHGRKQR